MRDPRSEPVQGPDHGAHTLKVWNGVVVGVYGDDVFVELGPRMQGVISVRQFALRPRIGDTHEYTLRGREDGLWALALRESASLSTWETMEKGSLVHARAIRADRDGLELKIGPLHAFMPKSHTGLPRDQRPDVLVGKTMTCEVIEVDSERQRVLVSRKLVAQRERDDDRQRDVGALSVGQVVHGRVTRLEPYGAFVSFGRGLEGMIHVSNLAYERVEHPGALLQLGQTVSAKVLALRNGGKRIALGLKQMDESPWRELERRLPLGRIVEGTVKRVLPFGAFVGVLPGIEGLVHNTQAELRGHKDLRAQLQPGERISVRVLSIDAPQERLALSLLHVDGRAILADEAPSHATFEALLGEAAARGTALNSGLGRLLRGALDDARKTRAVSDRAPDA
ncbi:MAG: 30S ribosomal protein S1 [Planctomycetes bacterium]|nr:30S ribosomal protein S1 [Planctomycetota bacterium]